MILNFYTTEKIGATRERTPEGFLLCRNVPIARTGVMDYVGGEIPINPGPDGMIHVMRIDDEVFRPDTIASFQGKAVTIGHPDVDVNPDNWNELAHGTVMNVRRGEGNLDDLLLADLLVTSDEAIKAILDGLVEVSCGYNADYEETRTGYGIQRNIIGNHVALVEAGRCGSRCSIGDQKPQRKEKDMAGKRKPLLHRLRDAIRTKDEAAQNEILSELGTGDDDLGGEGGEGATHVHVHLNGNGVGPTAPVMDDQNNPTGEPSDGTKTNMKDDDIEARFQALEQGHQEILRMLAELKEAMAGSKGGDEDPSAEEAKMLSDEAPEGKEEEAKMSKDSALFVNQFRDTISKAEILVPGIQFPTFDRAAKALDTVKSICSLRRKALDLAYSNPASRDFVDVALGGKTLDTKGMTCDSIRTVFNQASFLKSKANGMSSTRVGDASAPAAKKSPTNNADLNAQYKKFWADKAK